jgi:hypothetical protein
MDKRIAAEKPYRMTRDCDAPDVVPMTAAGEENRGPENNGTRPPVRTLDPPSRTLPDLVARALTFGRTSGYANAVTGLATIAARFDAVDTPDASAARSLARAFLESLANAQGMGTLPDADG